MDGRQTSERAASRAHRQAGSSERARPPRRRWRQRRHRPPVATAPVALARGAARLDHSQVTSTGDGERQLQQLFFPASPDTRTPNTATVSSVVLLVRLGRFTSTDDDAGINTSHCSRDMASSSSGDGDMGSSCSGRAGAWGREAGGRVELRRRSSAVAVGCAWPARARPVAVACVHVRLGWL